MIYYILKWGNLLVRSAIPAETTAAFWNLQNIVWFNYIINFLAVRRQWNHVASTLKYLEKNIHKDDLKAFFLLKATKCICRISLLSAINYTKFIKNSQKIWGKLPIWQKCEREVGGVGRYSSSCQMSIFGENTLLFLDALFWTAIFISLLVYRLGKHKLNAADPSCNVA